MAGDHTPFECYYYFLFYLITDVTQDDDCKPKQAIDYNNNIDFIVVNYLY